MQSEQNLIDTDLIHTALTLARQRLIHQGMLHEETLDLTLKRALECRENEIRAMVAERRVKS